MNVQNAVTWKCLKGFVAYFNINNNKTTIYEKRHSVVISSRFTHQTVLLKVVRCTPEMDKLLYCSSQWDSINTVRPTFHSYVWLLRLYLSSHITQEIVLNVTKTVKIYWYISTFFEVLMICLIFQFLTASYA